LSPRWGAINSGIRSSPNHHKFMFKKNFAYVSLQSTVSNAGLMRLLRPSWRGYPPPPPPPPNPHVCGYYSLPTRPVKSDLQYVARAPSYCVVSGSRRESGRVVPGVHSTVWCRPAMFSHLPRFINLGTIQDGRGNRGARIPRVPRILIEIGTGRLKAEKRGKEAIAE